MNSDIDRVWTNCINCDIPLVFKPQSLLHEYLLRKGRIINQPNYVFKNIFNTLVKVMQNERMLDLTNRGMIILTQDLSHTLNTRGLHAVQIPSAIYMQVLYSKEVEEIVETCNNILYEKECRNANKKRQLRYQWFLPKNSRNIYKCLQIPQHQELTSGGEIAAKMFQFISTAGIFDRTNNNICILKGNNSSTAVNLRIALGVDSFHTASLWDLVIGQFEEFSRHSSNTKRKNKHKCTDPLPSTSKQVAKNDKQTSINPPKRKENIKTTIRLLHFLIILVLAITKNLCYNSNM